MNEKPIINRQPFHPKTPVELESILALLILCTYEYAQRGNLSKMKYRAGQALALAMNMSLHSLGDEYDEFTEARRRAWWMTVRYRTVLLVSRGNMLTFTVLLRDSRLDCQYNSESRHLRL